MKKLTEAERLELIEVWRNASKIVAKVVADDLMPNIAMPRFPSKVLEQLNQVIRILEKN